MTTTSTPATASTGPSLLNRDAALSASDSRDEGGAGSEARVTILDVLASQVVQVQSLCDTILTTIDVLRQAARVPDREEEAAAPRATFGARRSPTA